MSRATISAVRFTASTHRDVESGLLGWVSFSIGDLLVIDRVTVRRTRAGGLTLSYPSRRDRAGADHPIARPINDSCRRELEARILEALGLAQAEEQP